MDKDEESAKIENFLQSLLDDISITDEEARMIFDECVTCHEIADWAIFVEHETIRLCSNCYKALRPLLDWKTSADTEMDLLRKAAGADGRKLVKYCRHVLSIMAKWENETYEAHEQIDVLVRRIVEKIGWRFFL